MSPDLRGWRVALVPDSLVNPCAEAPSVSTGVLSALADAGYGVLQLPPPGKHGLLLAVIADQVAEYAHHGYAVVAVGMDWADADPLHWRRLAPLLRHRGVALPPRFRLRAGTEAATELQRLRAFLADYDLPEAEQRRWRV